MSAGTKHTPWIVGLAFLSIVGSMTVLGLLGLASSRRGSELTRQSMRASSLTLAEKIVRKVEKRIIDQDRALFDLVDLRHLDDFKVFWDRLTTMSSLVEGALVLDSHQRILYYASKESPREQDRFREFFSRRILPRMEIANLGPGLHRHLHLRLDDREYLISYLVLVEREERFLVALKVNMAYLVNRMLPEEIGALEDRYVAAIRDHQGRLIHGQPLPAVLEPDSVRRSFPTTLYRWTLELAPRAGAPLAAHAERREQLNLLLVLASLAVAVFGLGMLLWVVRRERVVSALRRDLVTTVTHELKTPLSLIRMYAELMTLDRPGAAVRRSEYAGILSRETEKLGRLIDNVLDLSRMEQGRFLLDVREVDLRQVVEEAVTEARGRLVCVTSPKGEGLLRPGTLPASAQEGEGSISATAEVRHSLPEEPIPALVDPDAVRVVLLNLLDNAAKYGATQVDVGLRSTRRSWIIDVADNGPGISPEDRAHIFERFFRGKRALVSRERGSGIGLSLVQLVVEAHRGRVAVADRAGGGTIFSVSLPKATHRAERQPTAAPDREPQALGASEPGVEKSV